MTNTMNTPPCIYRSGCQRRDCVDQCLGLHSNREKQATQAPSKDKLTDVDLDALIRAYNAGGIAHGFVPEVYRCLVELKQMRNSPEPAAPIQQAARAFVAALDADAIAELVSTRGYQAEWNVLCDALRTAHEPLSGEALLKNLEGQCQALWRTNFTLVCTLPRGHDGDHRADCGYTFNGEVDVRPSPPPFDDPFQDRVAKWMVATFDAETVANKDERNHRFLEESLELVQSLGCTQAEAHMLVDYVFGRAVGECEQETGGVMVTLAALANASNIHVNRVAETELARCWTKIDVIRAKQAGKPKHSPLPGPTPTKGVSDAG